MVVKKPISEWTPWQRFGFLIATIWVLVWGVVAVIRLMEGGVPEIATLAGYLWIWLGIPVVIFIFAKFIKVYIDPKDRWLLGGLSFMIFVPAVLASIWIASGAPGSAVAILMLFGVPGLAIWLLIVIGVWVYKGRLD